MKKRMREPGYFDEPLCRSCGHAKVVHRGPQHVEDCAGLRCGCRRYEVAA